MITGGQARKTPYWHATVVLRDQLKAGRVEKASRAGLGVVMGKRSEKPKKPQKKQPQKTLKERRSEKRAAKKFGSG
jgi:hypothetical protein